MQYLDQTVEDLRLYLVRGDFQLEQFAVLRSSAFIWQEMNVSFGILGESHYVKFQRDGQTFAEICACKSASFQEPAIVLMTEFLVNIKKLPVECQLGAYSYAFTYECFQEDEGVMRVANLRASSRKSACKFLTYEFPKGPGSSISPITEIYCEQTLTGLLIGTVHTYPNSKQIAFTQSSINIRDKHG